MLSSFISRIVFGLAITAVAVSANLSQAGVIPAGTYNATGDGNGSATVTDIGPPINIELITVSKAFYRPWSGSISPSMACMPMPHARHCQRTSIPKG